MAALGRQAGFETVDLAEVKFTPDAPRVGRRQHGAHLRRGARRARRAAARRSRSPNPQNTTVLDDLALHDGRRGVGVARLRGQVKEAVDRHYARRRRGWRRSSRRPSARSSAEAASRRRLDLADAEAMAQLGARRQAAQLHPVPGHPRPRLATSTSSRSRTSSRSATAWTACSTSSRPPPLHLAPALISRIKVMCEPRHRRDAPAAGRPHRAQLGGRAVDLRVSTLPTMFGESCVLRVLDRIVVSPRPQASSGLRAERDRPDQAT